MERNIACNFQVRVLNNVEILKRSARNDGGVHIIETKIHNCLCDLPINYMLLYLDFFNVEIPFERRLNS